MTHEPDPLFPAEAIAQSIAAELPPGSSYLDALYAFALHPRMTEGASGVYHDDMHVAFTGVTVQSPEMSWFIVWACVAQALYNLGYDLCASPSCPVHAMCTEITARVIAIRGPLVTVRDEKEIAVWRMLESRIQRNTVEDALIEVRHHHNKVAN